MKTLRTLLFWLAAATCALGQAPSTQPVTPPHVPQHYQVGAATPSNPANVNVHVVARHADGTVFYDNSVHNLRTTGGADWQAGAMGTTGAQPATANYIALSNNGTAPAPGDCAAGSVTCTLNGEITLNGLARHQATYAHTNGTATWVLTYTWTATGTQSAQEAGMFNAASSGTMVFETAFTQVNLVATDTLSVTWTVTY